MKHIIYKEIASRLVAMANCEKSNNVEWYDNHKDAIESLIEDFLPSGSGVDAGTKLDFDASMGEKLVFRASYHHMNADGYYDGWTDHTITVTPSLAFGISIQISGRDSNDIKEYLHEIFHDALTLEVDSYQENGKVVYREVSDIPGVY